MGTATLTGGMSYDPVTTLGGIYPKELKIYDHPKTCTWVFTAALFIIAKTQMQPRWPSGGKVLNKLCSMRSTE
jgi:hypothetical protein